MSMGQTYEALVRATASSFEARWEFATQSMRA